MKQSNIIFATLLAAFVIYVTIRGQLPAYFSLFTGGGAAPVTNSEQGEPDSESNGATGDWNPLAEKLKIPATGDFLMQQFDNVFNRRSI